MIPIEERVANGAKFLDAIVPGWESRIDIDTLEMSDGSHCICGQTFAVEAEVTNTENGTVIDGFLYAFNHLFDQANLWVEAVLEDDGYLIRDKGDISELLGFDISDEDDPDENEDPDYDPYWALQVAWTNLLKDRKEKANAGVH